MRYKDFPKHDFRRILAVLATLEDLGGRATLHHAANALGCTRAEIARAILSAQRQFGAAITKNGAVYEVHDWGLVDRSRARAALPLDDAGELFWHGLASGKPVWTRQREADLVDALANAVHGCRTPGTDREADVYRLSAQLLKTRYRAAADFLDSAARQFYFQNAVKPRLFPQTVADGLVADVPRLRNLLEQRMEGVRSW